MEMELFRDLTCAGRSLHLSLCKLPKYLDSHDLPEELGRLSHADFVGHKSILRDDAWPGYYFTKNVSLGLNGFTFRTGPYGMLINLLQAGGPGATL